MKRGCSAAVYTMVLDYFYSNIYALHNTVYLFLCGHVALPSAVDVLPALGAPRASCTLDRKASICGLGRSLPACKHRHTITSGLQIRAAFAVMNCPQLCTCRESVYTYRCLPLYPYVA